MFKVVKDVIGKINNQYSNTEQIGGAVLLCASIFANFVNFVYNAYLGRVIGFEEFGLITLFGSFLNVSQIPLTAFSKTITYRSAYLYGKYDTPVRSFWRLMRSKVMKPTIVLMLVWLLAIPFLSEFFKTGSFIPFLLMTPIWTIGLFAAVDSGFLSGSLRLKTTALMTVVDVLSKFLISAFLINFGFKDLIYLAIPISALVSFFVGWAAVLLIKSGSHAKVRFRKEMYFPRKFYVSSIFAKVAAVVFLSADVMLAKHYLSPVEAGQYALLSLVGKMVFFLGALFNQFIIPFVSRDEGAGKNSKKTFDILMALTLMTVISGFIFVGAFGSHTVPFLLGSKALVIVEFLPFYVFAMGCLAIGSGIVSYHQSKQNHVFAVVSFVLSILTLLAIVFKHNSIWEINMVVTVGGISYLIIMYLLHRFEKLQHVISEAIEVFQLLFLHSSSRKNLPEGKLRVLIYNWRDSKHKWAGGAEAYVQELGQRWANEGHKVTLFCGNDGKSKVHQTIKGVEVIRKGNFASVYVWALLFYVFRFRKSTDVIIDCENGVPFFTPFYSRKPIILVIHHIHQEVFRTQLKFPINKIAQFMEGKLMPFIYNNLPIIAVSESTKKEIVKNKIAKAENIYIVHNGVSRFQTRLIAKSEEPLITYIGRLKPYKNVDTALYAFQKLLERFPSAKFAVIGHGESLKSLRKLSRKLELDKSVTFYGRTSESVKTLILRRSWIAVQPSMMEGWGLTVIEANACGTPVLASNVPGLSDSIIDEKTGLLVSVRNLEEWSEGMKQLICDHKLRAEMSLKALEWSQNFSWENSASTFMSIITKKLEQKENAFGSSFNFISKITQLRLRLPLLRQGGSL